MISLFLIQEMTIKMVVIKKFESESVIQLTIHDNFFLISAINKHDHFSMIGIQTSANCSTTQYFEMKITAS